MMSRPQLQDSESTAVPDKALLATVLGFLKTKNLKETEEALRKELSSQSEEDVELLGSYQVSAIGQSGTEPVHYEDSYTSHAPLSSTSQSTKAVVSQLANATPLSPTATAINCNQATPTYPTPCLPSSTQTLVEVEDEDDENDSEEDRISSVNITCKKMPVLIPFNDKMRNLHKIEELKGSKSKVDDVFDGPALSPAPVATTAAVSGVFDKNPLWVRSPLSLSSSNMSQPIIVPTSALSSPLGRQGVLIQSTPSTTATGLTSTSQNIGMHTQLLYQLAGPSGVATPLLGPVLTVFSPPSGLATAPSMFLTNPLQAPTKPSLDIQSLISKTFPATNPQIQTEKRSNSTTSEDTPLEKKVMAAEPTTGQTFSQDHLMSPVSSVPQPRTLASIPHSELTPEQLELKSFAEDFKTRRIRLGLTQGAVGQSLADKGYSNFAQSTISRFEQMQLSPSNAATIRIILEKWLIEAESPETAPANSGNALPMMAGRKRKKRAVFSSQTKSTLDEYFSQNPKPNRQVIEEISQKLDILPEEVRVWFCNKRQKSKSGTPLSDGLVAFEQDSSISTTSSSSNAPSPASSFEGAMAQKRRSPSPLKTPFTIEELSKSSIMSSPIQLSSPSLSSMGLVASVTQSRDHPMVFGSSHTNCSQPLVSNPLISQFLNLQQVAQTRA